MLNQDYEDDQFELDPDQSATTPLKRSKHQLVEITAATSSNNKSVLPRVHSKGKQLERNYSHQTIKDNSALRPIKKRDKSETLQPISKSLGGHRQNLQDKKRQRSLYNQGQAEQTRAKNHSESSFKANRRSEIELKIEQKKGILKKHFKSHNKQQLAIVPIGQSQKIQKYFHHSKADLIKLKVDEINRLNYKLREWIVNLNSELDHKINEALREKQTTTKLSKQKSSDQLVNLLESQVLNNEDRLALLGSEYSKLKQQTEQYDEEYSICLDQEKESIRSKLLSLSKIIVELRTLAGKKAGQLVHEKSETHPKIELVKEQIVKAKGQFQKNQDNLGRLEAKYSELTQNMSRLNASLQAKLNEAKQNNISLGENHLLDVVNSLKHKIDKSTTHNMYFGSKVTKNITKIQQQLRLLRNEAGHYDRDTQQVQEKIDKIAAHALELISNNHQNHLLNQNPSAFFFNKYHSGNDKNSIPFSTHFKHQNTLLKGTGLITIKESESAQAQPRKLSLQSNEAEFQNEFMNVEDKNHNSSTLEKEEINISLRDGENKLSPDQNLNLFSKINTVEERNTHKQQTIQAEMKAEVKDDGVPGEDVATISPKRFRFKRIKQE